MQELLTVGQCVPHVLCRGLVRIRCVLELPAILRFLSFKNYINTGIISGPFHDVFPQHSIKVSFTSVIERRFELLILINPCTPNATSTVFVRFSEMAQTLMDIWIQNIYIKKVIVAWISGVTLVKLKTSEVLLSFRMANDVIMHEVILITGH